MNSVSESVGSSTSAWGGGTPKLMLFILLAILLLIEAWSIYKSWRRGTLFDNLIRSAIVYGLPFLIIVGFGLIFLLGNGRGCAGCGSGSDSSSPNDGWYTGSYQGYREEIDGIEEINSAVCIVYDTESGEIEVRKA